MQSIYDVDYFIKKFEAIPNDQWATCSYITPLACCALGHCGSTSDYDDTDESAALKKIFSSMGLYSIQYINDKTNPRDNKYAVAGIEKYFIYPTPKQRILAALYDIKNIQQPVPEPKKEQPIVKERIVYVAVPESIKEQVTDLIMQ